MKITKKATNIIERLWKILIKPEMLVLPGQLAFFLLLAIVPMVTLIVYGISLFNVSPDFLSSFLIRAFGNDIKDLLIPIINEIKFTKEFLVPLCVAYYAASGGASSIIITSNELYHIENSTFLKRKIKGLIMTFLLITLIIFLLLVPAFGDKIINLIKLIHFNRTITNSLIFIVNISKGPISWLLIFFLIKIIYTMAPDKNLPSKFTTKGSLFTTFGFVISTGIYSFYVNNVAHYDILYGGLSHFIVLMIWFYIIAYIITIGIAINQEDILSWQKKEE